MTKKKLYFKTFDGSEMDLFAYPLARHIEDMRMEGITEMTVVEAIPEKTEGYFFCGAMGEVCETGDCSKSCRHYNPRNKKSGICSHKSLLYGGGKDKLIKLKP